MNFVRREIPVEPGGVELLVSGTAAERRRLTRGGGGGGGRTEGRRRSSAALTEMSFMSATADDTDRPQRVQ